jgi:hypothetical protein
MYYKAERAPDGSWSVLCNGIAVFAGLTEDYARQLKSQFQREADQFDRVNQEDE